MTQLKSAKVYVQNTYIHTYIRVVYFRHKIKFNFGLRLDFSVQLNVY